VAQIKKEKKNRLNDRILEHPWNWKKIKEPAIEVPMISLSESLRGKIKLVPNDGRTSQGQRD